MSRKIKVLKSNLVKVSGSVRLTPEAAVAPVRTAFSASADTPQTAAHPPQSARIVDSNNDCAVIEVICSCGNKSHIRCKYAGPAKSEK